MTTHRRAQASSAAASYAEAMQVSAAELLSRGVISPPPHAPPDGSREVLPQATSSAEGTTPAAGESASWEVPEGAAHGVQQPAGAQIGLSEPTGNAAEEGFAAHQLPGDFPSPLYSPEALQLWLLQCCQQVRGIRAPA